MTDELYPDLKACAHCKELKPRSEFFRNKAKKDGLDHRCKSCKQGYQKVWQAKNPQVGRRYQERNKERIYEKHREWVANNLEKVRAWNLRHALRWRTEHPEERRAHNRRQQQLRRQAEGYFTQSEWDLLCSACDYRCLRCGDGDAPLTIDHIVPISSGGTNWITNLQPLCMPCNHTKYTKAIDYRTAAIAEAIAQIARCRERSGDLLHESVEVRFGLAV